MPPFNAVPRYHCRGGECYDPRTTMADDFRRALAQEATMAIEPFRITVPEAVLEDLQQRLARTRFPDQVNDGNWSYGRTWPTFRN